MAIATVAILKNSSGMTLSEGGVAMPVSVLTFSTIWLSEHHAFSVFHSLAVLEVQLPCQQGLISDTEAVPEQLSG